MTKRIFSLTILALTIGLFFTGCKMDEMNSITQNYEGGAKEFDQDCFSFVYPIELNFEDGTSTTINTDADLEMAFDDWFKANGEDAEDPLPTFPITVLLAPDGKEQVINNVDELDDLFIDCYGDYDDYDGHGEECFDEYLDFTDCFEINYPVNVKAPDGNTIIINNDEELEALLDTSDLDFEPVFPITLTSLEDDSQIVITNEDEFFEALDECFGEFEDEFEFMECFSFNYPLDLVKEDGSTITVNNDEELEDAFYDSYEEDEDLEFVYPLTLTLLGDGSTVTANDEDELDALFDECYGEDFDMDFSDCFTVNYPVELLKEDGTRISVNDDTELETAFEDAYTNEEDLEIVFPVSVTLASDGSTQTLNSEDELEELLDSCD